MRRSTLCGCVLFVCEVLRNGYFGSSLPRREPGLFPAVKFHAANFHGRRSGRFGSPRHGCLGPAGAGFSRGNLSGLETPGVIPVPFPLATRLSSPPLRLPSTLLRRRPSAVASTSPPSPSPSAPAPPSPQLFVRRPPTRP